MKLEGQKPKVGIIELDPQLTQKNPPPART